MRLKYLAEISTGDFNTQDALDDGEYPFYVRSPIIRKLNSYSYDGIGILMSGDGVGAGKIFHYAVGKYAVHQRVYIIHNFKKQLCPKYVYYYLSHMFPKLVDAWSAKSTVDSIRLPMLSNFEISLPSCYEQERIANFIDRQCSKINSLIDKTKQSIIKLEEYKKSLITKAVTKGLDPNVEMKNSGVHWIGEIPKNWNLSKIKYIAELNPTVSLYQIKPCSRVTFTPMEYIKNGYYIPHDCEYSAISRGSYTQYQEDDIVIAKVTPCFENGNIAIMHNLLSGLGLGSSELFVLRAKNILKEYLFFFLQSEKFKTQGVLSFSGASGLKRVSSAFILNCPLPVPSIEEQRHISNFLYKKSDDIHKLISQKQSIINKLEEYRKSLIFEYVTGKKSVEEN